MEIFRGCGKRVLFTPLTDEGDNDIEGYKKWTAKLRVYSALRFSGSSGVGR